MSTIFDKIRQHAELLKEATELGKPVALWPGVEDLAAILAIGFYSNLDGYVACGTRERAQFKSAALMLLQQFELKSKA